MTDSVKFIFKSLLKVPIIIFVTYFIFNLFAFAISYFRLLGLSYVVLQTAIENNYLPYDAASTGLEGNTLVSYAESLETAMLTDITIGCDSVSGSGVDPQCTDITDTSTNMYNTKVQYGQPITVTVSAEYVWLLPLATKTSSGEYKVDTGNGGLTALDYNESEHNIVISYTVPGLKYYPDLN